MAFSFRTEQWLPYPVDTVFSFLADPANLPQLMPAWQKPRLESVTLAPPPRANASHSMEGAAGAGSRIVLSLRPLHGLPVRVRWHAEIIDFSWNSRFCDRQIRGPFAFWQHTHSVRALDRDGPGVTILTDEVEYELPFGALGRLAHRLSVRRQIVAIFAYRHARIVDALAQTRRPQTQVSQAG